MVYTISIRTVNTFALNSCLEISTPSSYGVKIFEIGVSNIAAVATAISLAYPTTASTSPEWLPYSRAIGEQDPALPTTNVKFAQNWATPASIANATTSPSIRRASLSAAVGAGACWSFPKGLYLAPGSKGLTSLCLFNVLANSIGLDVWVTFDA